MLCKFEKRRKYPLNRSPQAGFLDLTNEIKGVLYGKLLLLGEKWAIAISTQCGCSMGHKFCDVPEVGVGINAFECEAVGLNPAQAGS